MKLRLRVTTVSAREGVIKRMEVRAATVWILVGLAARTAVPARAKSGPELLPSRKSFVEGFLKAAGRSPWPDYRPDGQPLLLEFGGKDGGAAVLVSGSSAPEGFVPIIGLDKPSRRVLWRPGASPAPYVLLPAEPGAAYPRNFMRYHVRDGERANAALSTMLHELFHVHQERTFSPWPIAVVFPYDDAETLASLNIEHLLLSRALSDGDRWLETARDFVALRSERRRSRPETAAAEDSLERLEGIAEYVSLNSAPPEQGASVRESRVTLSLMLKLLHDNRSSRPRYYPSGAALGMLLDRGKLDWKQRVADGMGLFPLLAETLPMSEAESSERLRRVRTSYSFTQVQAESAILLREESDERAKIAAAFTHLGRWLVILRVPSGVERTLSEGVTSPAARFDDGTEISSVQFLSKRFGHGVSLSLRQTAMMETPDVSRDAAIRFPLDAAAVIKLDGVPWVPADVSLKFRSLEIRGKHSDLLLHRPGRIQIRGREMSITWEGN